VMALRTAKAKYATYTNWGPEGIAPLQEGEEWELYDYRTGAGRMELHNGASDRRAGAGPLQRKLQRAMQRALQGELRAPLPSPLREAHGLGFENYFLTAKKAARGATAARLRRLESETGPLSPFGRRPLDGSQRPRGALAPHLARPGLRTGHR
jgi:hypothetical protein